MADYSSILAPFITALSETDAKVANVVSAIENLEKVVSELKAILPTNPPVTPTEPPVVVTPPTEPTIPVEPPVEPPALPVEPTDSEKLVEVTAKFSALKSAGQALLDLINSGAVVSKDHQIVANLAAALSASAE